MNSSVEKAFKKWLYYSERAASIFKKGDHEIAESSFEAGHKAGAKSITKPLAALATEYAMRDYDEAGLQELLVKLNAILNPQP